jgi:hypothetical protein
MSAPSKNAIACSLLAALLCTPTALAQNARRPESFQLAIGMQSRGLHEEAAKYLGTFLRDHAQRPRSA